MMQEVKAMRITWEDVSSLIQSAVQSILGTQFMCKARCNDYNYWSTMFLDRRIMMSEAYAIFEKLKATNEQINTSLPCQEERAMSVDSLGMPASSLILSYALNRTWKEECVTEDALWLLDVSTVPKNTEDEYESILNVD